MSDNNRDFHGCNANNLLLYRWTATTPGNGEVV